VNKELEQELIKILEENRNAKIPDEHWKGFFELQKKNAEQFEAEDRAMTPTFEDMNRRFDL